MKRQHQSLDRIGPRFEVTGGLPVQGQAEDKHITLSTVEKLLCRLGPASGIGLPEGRGA